MYKDKKNIRILEFPDKCKINKWINIDYFKSFVRDQLSVHLEWYNFGSVLFVHQQSGARLFPCFESLPRNGKTCEIWTCMSKLWLK